MAGEKQENQRKLINSLKGRLDGLGADWKRANPKLVDEMLTGIDNALKEIESGIPLSKIGEANLDSVQDNLGRAERTQEQPEVGEPDVEKPSEEPSEELEEKQEESKQDDEDLPEDKKKKRKKKRKKQDGKSKDGKSQPKPKPKPSPATAPKPPVPVAGAGVGATATGGAAAAGGAVAGGAAVAGGGAVATAGGAAVVVTAPAWLIPVLVILLVLLIILVFYFIFAGGQNKAFDEAGGSVFVEMRCESEYDKQLVLDVEHWTNTPPKQPRLFIVPQIASDIQWQGSVCGEDMTHKLDKRVMETLRYLVADAPQGVAWSKISVGMLTNGPHKTIRPARGKELEQMNNKATVEGEENEQEDNKSIVAFSAYGAGQAIGIISVGLTSGELTTALGIVPPIPIPVAVDWQKGLAINVSYPLYEAMQYDASYLYNDLLEIMLIDSYGGAEFLREQQEENSAEGETLEELEILEVYTKAQERIHNLQRNIRRVLILSSDPTFSDIAQDYFRRAIFNFNRADEILDAALGESDDAFGNFVDKWAEGRDNPEAVGVGDDDMGVYQNIREGIRFTFRAMQVANMEGWRGNTIWLPFWQAYEARQNIRQLTLDLIRMPIDLRGTVDDSFGPIVKQIITFSVEDDLDNGLPDLDVYPNGAMYVGEGGVGFVPVVDGKVDAFDAHFSSVQVDNGSFAKLCSYFVYDTSEMTVEEIGGANSVLGTYAPSFAENALCNVLYGFENYELEENEIGGRVSYQKFFHIGF